MARALDSFTRHSPGLRFAAAQPKPGIFQFASPGRKVAAGTAGFVSFAPLAARTGSVMRTTRLGVFTRPVRTRALRTQWPPPRGKSAAGWPLYDHATNLSLAGGPLVSLSIQRVFNFAPVRRSRGGPGLYNRSRSWLSVW
jgi:hypothetical protein